MEHKRACGWSQENVASQVCAEEGCKRQPSFNVHGKTKAKYCKFHARPGMVRPDCLSLRPGSTPVLPRLVYRLVTCQHTRCACCSTRKHIRWQLLAHRCNMNMLCLQISVAL